MPCLPRQISSIKTCFHLLTRRHVPSIVNWQPPLVRCLSKRDIKKSFTIKRAQDKAERKAPNPYNEQRIPKAELKDKKLSKGEEKKAIRKARRELEKKEANIPGTLGFIKAQKKAQKLERKLARNARKAAGEGPPVDHPVEALAWKQSEQDTEALRKKREKSTKQNNPGATQRRMNEERRGDISSITPSEKHRVAAKAERPNEPKDTYDFALADWRQDGLEDRPQSTKDCIRKDVSDDASDWDSSAMGSDALGLIDASERSTLSLPSFSRSDRRRDSKRDGRDNDTASFAPSNRQKHSFDHGSDKPVKISWKDTNSLQSDDSTRSSTRSFDRNSEREERRPWEERNAFQSDERAERPWEGKQSRKPNNQTSNSASPFTSKYNSRSFSEPLANLKREPWQVEKDATKQKYGEEGWAPKKRLSPDTLEGIRTMHASDPERFSTPILADQFKVSPEVIRRILKAKWQPDEETVKDRQERWARRGERIWTKQAELGVRPPKKWREMGVTKTEPGVAPKWKKNAHSKDSKEKYGEQPKHFVAQRRGAWSGSVDLGHNKSFSERML